MDQQQPKAISVIIPNVNSLIITQTIAALHKQNIDLSGVEVLIVGRDDTGQIQNDGLVRCIPGQKEMTPAQNRNLGIQQACSDIICFIDADCLPETDWLTKLTTPYADPEISVVGGGVRFVAENYWSLCDNLSWFAPYLASTSPGTRPILPTLNFSLRRSVVEKVGLIDESYPAPAGEDTEWTSRMRAHGYQLHFVPEAIVHHCHRRADFRALWQHGYLYGRHSTIANLEMPTDRKPRWQERFFPRQSWAVLLLSPILALGATTGILTWKRTDPTMWRALFGIWLSKIAWCIGASQALRNK